MEKIAIAPMLDWTDRHYRYFMRQITKCAELYTEMIVADAILHGNVAKLLEYSEIEQPVVVQLGGSNPDKLAKASKICAEYGYSAINLNVGCPSERVKSGNFGACLMADASLVASCIKAMQDTVSIPITVKHRTGLNYDYNYEYMRDFVAIIAETGCNDFIVHARNAILKGLSPKQNRDIPPLRYDYVYKLKQEMPHLNVMNNGGIKTEDEMHEHLKTVDGVMIGREAYHNPYFLHNVDNLIFGHQNEIVMREHIAEAMIPYLIAMQKQGIHVHHITRHMIGLYHGCNRAKLWRHTLTQEIIKTNDIKTYTDLLHNMSKDTGENE